MNESTHGAQAPLESSESSESTGTETFGAETRRPQTTGPQTTGMPMAGTEAPAGTDGEDASAHDPAAIEDAEGEPGGGRGGDEANGDEASVTEAPGGRSKRKQALYNEGEIAADFLETLLDIADLDGDLDVDVDGDRAAIAIVDSEEGRVSRRLVGERGVVLEALQELARLAVQAETGERSRLMLDIAGHRAARRTELVRLAKDAIAKARSTGSKVSLDPMSAFERKVVHDEVTAAGLESESEGVEPRRYIVIHPVG